MSEALATRSTVSEIKAEVQLIQQILEGIMKKDVHYGTIPGTPKPTLYKPGSEKILRTFHIGVDPSENVQDLSTDDEIRYRVFARAFNQATGATLGVGVGECSSNEEKYKWRRPVCDEEFNEMPEDRKREKWVRGQNNKPNYKIKQIRTNPADVANTILKMAKKRAQIDMTLTVTAASDVFEQDLEDLPEEIRDEVVRNKGNGKAPMQAPQEKKDPPPPDNTLTVASVIVAEVLEQDGVNKKTGKPYTKYTIKDADGEEYGTFSQTFAQFAHDSIGSGLPVQITYKQSKFGKDVENVTLPEGEGEKE